MTSTAELIRLYETPLTLEQVAKRCGLDRSTVARRLEEANYRLRKPGRIPKSHLHAAMRDDLLSASDKASAEEKKRGSRALARRILILGARGGIPGASPRLCRERLEALG